MGALVEEHVPTKVRQVISSSTASELSRMLQSVIVNGSGQRGAVPGYAVQGRRVLRKARAWTVR